MLGAEHLMVCWLDRTRHMKCSYEYGAAVNDFEEGKKQQMGMRVCGETSKVNNRKNTDEKFIPLRSAGRSRDILRLERSFFAILSISLHHHRNHTCQNALIGSKCSRRNKVSSSYSPFQHKISPVSKIHSCPSVASHSSHPFLHSSISSFVAIPY